MKKLLLSILIFNSLIFIAQDPIHNKDSTVKFNLAKSPTIGFSFLLHDFNSINQELSITQAPELKNIWGALSVQQTLLSRENFEKDKEWILSHNFNWQNIKQDNDSSLQTGLNYYQYYLSFNYNILPASKEVNLYVGLGLGGSVYKLSISDVTDLNSFESVLETFNSSNVSKSNGIAQLNIACQTKFINIGLAYTFNAINGKWKRFENKINNGPDMGLGILQLKITNVF